MCGVLCALCVVRVISVLVGDLSGMLGPAVGLVGDTEIADHLGLDVLGLSRLFCELVWQRYIQSPEIKFMAVWLRGSSC